MFHPWIIISFPISQSNTAAKASCTIPITYKKLVKEKGLVKIYPMIYQFIRMVIR
jgi:hypothetical protein